MVLPAAAAAARVAGAGATAIGLGMGKSDLDLTRQLFLLQMQQAKRLWTADFCENSVRHGESLHQAAVQHAQGVAWAGAAHAQAEKLAAHAITVAAQQDARSYEMAWRAEVRESLRDELANQNNRFNILMLCDTVCLSCVFSLLADGNPPQSTRQLLLNLYVLTLGLSTTLFTISMWCCVIVVRRLHEHTAATLEQKIFVQCTDLQNIWAKQVADGIPTGPYEMYLVNQAYEAWLDVHVNQLGNVAIHLLSAGVVTMFVTAGLLTHTRYQLEFDASTAVLMFWSMVAITSTAVVVMKYAEDKMEKQKRGVYDASWQDQTTTFIDKGPFAKIAKAAAELAHTVSTMGGGSKSGRDGGGTSSSMELLLQRERQALQACPDAQTLQQGAARMRALAQQRATTRKEVLQLLTTAAEELDALPEELLAKLNKLLHDIDEADAQVARHLALAASVSNNSQQKQNSSRSPSLQTKSLRRSTVNLSQRPPTLLQTPVDAQRLPVSLTALRKKLGEISLTTMIRIRNLTDEPLRLVSGIKLQEGRYIKSLALAAPQSDYSSSSNTHHHLQTFHFYPSSEIAPHTEVVMVARSGGGWVPTSGIGGQIVYTNRQQTWTFHVKFANELVRGGRHVHVQANPTGKNENSNEIHPSLSLQPSTASSMDDTSQINKNDLQHWQITRQELDRKANNEILVSIRVQKRQDDIDDDAAIYSSGRYTKSPLKCGFLQKNRPTGFRLQWQQRWFVLTWTRLTYAHDRQGKKETVIPISDIVGVRRGLVDVMQKHVLEVVVQGGREPYRLAATSAEDRDEWMDKIATVLHHFENSASTPTGDSEDTLKGGKTKLRPPPDTEEPGSIECIQSERGFTEVLSV